MSKAAVVLLALCFCYVCGLPKFAHLVNKREKYCGRKLVNNLNLICRGVGFNGPSKPKRSDAFSYNDLGFGTDEDSVEGLLYGGELERPGKRNRQGIIEECCFQDCTMHQLAAYCS